MKFKALVHSDYKRYKSDNGNFLKFIKLFLANSGFRAVAIYRIARFFWIKKKFMIIPSVCQRLLRHLCHCYISPAADIGAGFLISHVGGIVIGSGTKIGENCDIRQNITFGGNYNKKSNDGRTKPIVGDNVSFGVGSVILGPITIGNNSIIGANSVVVKNIPADVIVAGNPAKIISAKWSKNAGRKL